MSAVMNLSAEHWSGGKVAEGNDSFKVSMAIIGR